MSILKVIDLSVYHDQCVFYDDILLYFANSSFTAFHYVCSSLFFSVFLFMKQNSAEASGRQM